MVASAQFGHHNFVTGGEFAQGFLGINSSPQFKSEKYQGPGTISLRTGCH